MSGGSSAASASRSSGRSQAAQTGSTNRSAALKRRPRTRQRPSKAVSRLRQPIRPSGSQAPLRTRRNGSNTRMKMSRPASRALPAGRKAGSKPRSPIRGLTMAQVTIHLLALTQRRRLGMRGRITMTIITGTMAKSPPWQWVRLR